MTLYLVLDDHDPNVHWYWLQSERLLSSQTDSRVGRKVKPAANHSHCLHGVML